MDPRYSAQDVVRCALCRTAEAPMYCEVCHINICKDCVEKHFSDKSKVHKVVPLKQFLSATKCPSHPDKQCDLQCEQCDIPVCTICVSSQIHKHHLLIDIMKYCDKKQGSIRRDLQEIEKNIYPYYQEAASNIEDQKADTHKHFEELRLAVNKHGKTLHTEIDTIIQSRQAEIDDMDAKCLTALDVQKDAINHKITEIKQTIQDLKMLLVTRDVGIVSTYKSNIKELRHLLPKLKITFSNFQPQKINRRRLLEQFGLLSPLSFEEEKQSYSPQFPGTESMPPELPPKMRQSKGVESFAKPLPNYHLLPSRLITKIATGFKSLLSVSCLTDEEIWTSGDEKIMKLYNLHGKLLKSIETKSGSTQEDIATTRNGYLMYTDPMDRSINLVKSEKIQTLIRLNGWKPLNVCSSSFGNFLVTMISDDYKQAKVVRYSGSKEIQTIQWDDQGKPLYASGGTINKYLSENKNLDICVADRHASAVVVVSRTGKLRFRYTGITFPNKRPFKPYGIATDSHWQILTSDCDNQCIHVLNQDGQFLHYIDNCGFQHPMGLCVDSRDNLFVAEKGTGEVKKIQYSK